MLYMFLFELLNYKEYWKIFQKRVVRTKFDIYVFNYMTCRLQIHNNVHYLWTRTKWYKALDSRKSALDLDQDKVTWGFRFTTRDSRFGEEQSGIGLLNDKVEHSLFNLYVAQVFY